MMVLMVLAVLLLLLVVVVVVAVMVAVAPTTWLGETNMAMPKAVYTVDIVRWECLSVGCLTSQQQTSVSQGRIC